MAGHTYCCLACMEEKDHSASCERVPISSKSSTANSPPKSTVSNVSWMLEKQRPDRLSPSCGGHVSQECFCKAEHVRNSHLQAETEVERSLRAEIEEYRDACKKATQSERAESQVAESLRTALVTSEEAQRSLFSELAEFKSEAQMAREAAITAEINQKHTAAMLDKSKAEVNGYAAEVASLKSVLAILQEETTTVENDICVERVSAVAPMEESSESALSPAVENPGDLPDLQVGVGRCGQAVNEHVTDEENPAALHRAAEALKEQVSEEEKPEALGYIEIDKPDGPTRENSEPLQALQRITVCCNVSIEPCRMISASNSTMSEDSGPASDGTGSEEGSTASGEFDDAIACPSNFTASETVCAITEEGEADLELDILKDIYERTRLSLENAALGHPVMLVGLDSPAETRKKQGGKGCNFRWPHFEPSELWDLCSEHGGLNVRNKVRTASSRANTRSSEDFWANLASPGSSSASSSTSTSGTPGDFLVHAGSFNQGNAFIRPAGIGRMPPLMGKTTHSMPFSLAGPSFVSGIAAGAAPLAEVQPSSSRREFCKQCRNWATNGWHGDSHSRWRGMYFCKRCWEDFTPQR